MGRGEGPLWVRLGNPRTEHIESASPPGSGHVGDIGGCPRWAKSGLMHRSKFDGLLRAATTMAHVTTISRRHLGFTSKSAARLRHQVGEDNRQVGWNRSSTTEIIAEPRSAAQATCCGFERRRPIEAATAKARSEKQRAPKADGCGRAKVNSALNAMHDLGKKCRPDFVYSRYSPNWSIRAVERTAL